MKKFTIAVAAILSASLPAYSSTLFVDTVALHLGLADAPAYSGAPGAYLDNHGALDVSFSVVPEPSSALPGVASAGLLTVRRGRAL